MLRFGNNICLCLFCDYSFPREQLTIFTTNSVEYIQRFNGDFLARSSNKKTLVEFIGSKLNRGGSGYWCRTRILYALDPADYYTEMIKDYLGKRSKYKREVAEIFVQRMEVDLNIIQTKWKQKKYGKGKDPSLRAAIEKAAGKTKKSGYFLVKMLPCEQLQPDTMRLGQQKWQQMLQ